MCKKIVWLTSVALVCGLMSTASYGQLDGLYEFDAGGDGTSWDDPANWEQVLDPNGLPISGDPATPPGPTTSADIPLLGVVLVDNTQLGQTALDVRVGTAAGGGSVTISGGDLTARDVLVGADAGGINLGLVAMSGGTLDAGDDIELGRGSVGIMTMSGGSASVGDDFVINTNSSLTMTGGTLHVGDRLVTNSNAGVVVSGGDIVADDDFFFFGNSEITVNSGSMTVADKLRFDDVLTAGTLTVNGGLVRTQEFGFVDDLDNYIMNGTLEINGSGIFQSEAPEEGDPISQLSIAQANALILAGTITTSEVAPLGLIVQSVVVPDFFGNLNLTFTQISVGRIPEPSSVLLLGLGGFGWVLRRRRA